MNKKTRVSIIKRMSGVSLKEIPHARLILARKRAIFLGFAAGAVVAVLLYVTVVARLGQSTRVQTYDDPYQLALSLARYDGSILVVDLRDRISYEKEHILHAVNVEAPIKGHALSDPNRMIGKIRTMAIGKKSIVLYGATQFSEEPALAVAALRSAGIQAQELPIGWNEWKHFRTLWVPESALDTLPTLVEGQQQMPHGSTIPQAPSAPINKQVK